MWLSATPNPSAAAQTRSKLLKANIDFKNNWRHAYHMAPVIFLNSEEPMAKETTKTVEFIRNTVAGGKPVKVGEKATLPAQEAQFLIHINKAKAVEAAPAEVETPQKSPDGDENAGLDLDKMKVEDLKKLAAANEIELPAGAKKAKIVEIIAAALVEKAQADDQTGTEDGDDTGADQGEGEELPENNT